MLWDLIAMKTLAALLGIGASAIAQVATTTQPSQSDIAASAATVEPYSPVSNVEGLAFNRSFQVWFENIVRSWHSLHACSHG